MIGGTGGRGRRESGSRPLRSCAESSMDAPLLTDDFKEFLKLFNAHRVEYLVVGGYAVGVHGYPRATVDLGRVGPLITGQRHADIRSHTTGRTGYTCGMKTAVSIPDEVFRRADRLARRRGRSR